MLQAIIIVTNDNTQNSAGENQNTAHALHLLSMLPCLSCQCVCLCTRTGDLSDHESLVSELTVDPPWCSRSHKGTELGAMCAYSPKHFYASLGDTAAHDNASGSSTADAVILYCLGNKDKKSVYMFGIDTLFLDIFDLWLKSWIWNQWIWSIDFPFMI